MLPCNPLKGQTVPDYKTKRMCFFEIIFKGCMKVSQGHKPTGRSQKYCKAVKHKKYLLNTFQFQLRRNKSYSKHIISVHLQFWHLSYPTLLQEKPQTFRNALSGHNNALNTMKPLTVASDATIVLKPHFSNTVLTIAVNYRFNKGHICSWAKILPEIVKVLLCLPPTKLFTQGVLKKHSFSELWVTVQ